MTLLELKTKKADAVKRAKALVDKAKAESNRDLTPEEGTQVDAAIAESEGLDNQIADAEKVEDRKAKIAKIETEYNALTQSMGTSAAQRSNTATNAVEGRGQHTETREEKRDKELAGVKLYHSLRSFPNDRDGRWRAMRFGMWCLALHAKGGGVGAKRALRYCQENGLDFRTDEMSEEEHRAIQQENINYAGGYLVPDEFLDDIIFLTERYGVFRKFAKMIPMKRDSSSRPRRTGGLTAYFVGEGAAGTASTKGWDLVSLTAKKIMALTLYSSELNEDAVVNIGDDLAREMALAFAKKEDSCGFLGDGTSTYGGINGLSTCFLKQGATQAYQSNTVTLTGSAWSSIVLADFNNMVARLPAYADTVAQGNPGDVGPAPTGATGPCWFCSKQFFHQVIQRLLYAAGGERSDLIAATTLKQGGYFQFMGYPVVFAQILPSAYVQYKYAVFFGDLGLACDFGDRRAQTLAFSNSATIGSTNAFAADALAVRMTERFDINIHDCGNYNSSVANWIPGPIVAGYQA